MPTHMSWEAFPSATESHEYIMRAGHRPASIVLAG